jgi:hypothetical protein
MPAELHHLHIEIAKVCPIAGISGDMKEHRKVEIQFLDKATEAQKTAAKIALMNFDVNKKYDADPAAFLDEAAQSLFFTDAEFIALTRCLAIVDPAARKSYFKRALSLSDTQSNELKRLCTAHCITL